MNKDKKKWIILSGMVGLGIIIAIMSYLVNFYSSGISKNTTNWGTFGEYIGGVIGTLFNFTSVVLIFLTFQRQEENSNLQQFETTFFNMLSNHRDIVKSLTGFLYDFNSRHPVRKNGAEFLSIYSGYLKTDMDKGLSLDLDLNSQKEFIQKSYDENYLQQASTLGHYFRHLYHIVKYTDESLMTNKKKYIDIIQSQMSDDELYCNFYNSISKYGDNKFLPLLDEYSFFENITSRSKMFDIHKMLFFHKTKFKNSFKDLILDEIN